MSPMSPKLLRPRARQAGALPPDPNANLRSGLIAFYPLSNGSDSSGNGRNLTATNITYQAGKIENGAYFDGSAYFATSSLPAFTGADMTIAGWFKIIGEDYEDYLIGAGDGDDSLYVVCAGGDIKASASESNVEDFAGGSGADDGNWHFFAVTRTATQKKVWLDQTVNSVGGTYGAMNNPTPFAIGSNGDNWYLLLDGMMDAVGIWNRALSDAEIAQLYNAGAGLEISATPPVAPDAPTSLSGTAGNGQVSLSWTAPASNGGAAITDYAVQLSSDGGSTWSTFADGTSTATSATVTGLTNGTAYVFRVAAVNAAGTGAYTAASSSVTPNSATVPGAPTGIGTTEAGSSCFPDWLISFSAPSSNGGSSITGYRIRTQADSFAAFRSITSGNAFKTAANGIVNFDTWNGGTVRISAVNAIGEGAFGTVNVGATSYQCGD